MKHILSFVIMLILTLTLAACGFQPATRTVLPVTAEPELPNTGSIEPTASPEPAATTLPQATPVPEEAVATPTATPETPDAAEQAGVASGTVIGDNLDLRLGPGFDHRVIKLLSRGQALAVHGRSTNGVWLEVRLPDGTGGWVFTGYVEVSVPVADLPVTEASGGPLGESPGAEPSSGGNRLDILVTIVDQQGRISLQNFPANQQLAAYLGLPGETADLLVASGSTDASGAAELTFSLPDELSNGKPVVESELILVVSTASGEFSRTATIQYIRGQ